MGLGERSLSQQRVGHGDLHGLREHAQLLARARDDRAVSHEEHRPLRRVEQLRRACNLVGVPVLRHVVAGEVELLVRRGARWSCWSSFGGCRRARGPAGRTCQVERLAENARDIRRVLDQVGMLDHGERYPGDIRLLESVHAEVLHAGLPGDARPWGPSPSVP